MDTATEEKELKSLEEAILASEEVKITPPEPREAARGCGAGVLEILARGMGRARSRAAVEAIKLAAEISVEMKTPINAADLGLSENFLGAVDRGGVARAEKGGRLPTSRNYSRKDQQVHCCRRDVPRPRRILTAAETISSLLRC